MERLLLARINDPPDCPSIVGQGKAARPRSQAFSTCHFATTQREARLAGLLASAFALLNTPAVSRQHQRRRTSVRATALSGGVHHDTCANSSMPQQLPARPTRSTRTTHPNDLQHDLMCNADRPPRAPARASKWLAPTFVIKDASTSPLFNRSRRWMLRHQVRHVVICGNSLQQEFSFLRVRSCVHMCRISKCLSLPEPVLRTIPRQALLSLTRGITSLPASVRTPPARWIARPVVASPTQRRLGDLRRSLQLQWSSVFAPRRLPNH